jgi:hypothetical protein
MPIDITRPSRPNLQNVRNPCAGAFLAVNSEMNPSFNANGGSYHDDTTLVHKCDIKIVLVEEGFNVNVNFHLFTDVPIPSRWKGVVLDDRLPQANPKATLFEELKGVPHMPVGVRDYMGTQLTNVETDVSTFICCAVAYCFTSSAN